MWQFFHLLVPPAAREHRLGVPSNQVILICKYNSIEAFFEAAIKVSGTQRTSLAFVEAILCFSINSKHAVCPRLFTVINIAAEYASERGRGNYFLL